VNYYLYSDHVDTLETDDDYDMLLLEEIDEAEKNPDQGLPLLEPEHDDLVPIL
jgi:hypothetical protein